MLIYLSLFNIFLKYSYSLLKFNVWEKLAEISTGGILREVSIDITRESVVLFTVYSKSLVPSSGEVIVNVFPEID